VCSSLIIHPAIKTTPTKSVDSTVRRRTHFNDIVEEHSDGNSDEGVTDHMETHIHTDTHNGNSNTLNSDNMNEESTDTHRHTSTRSTLTTITSLSYTDDFQRLYKYFDELTYLLEWENRGISM